MQPQPSRSAVTAFAAEPTSATAARRFVRQTLDGAGVPNKIADRAELIVSELVTNAVLHAGAGPVVSLRFNNQTVRIEVEDTSPAAPVLREYGLDASTGRGLRVVGHAATEWGVETTSSGKSVWAILEATQPLPSAGVVRSPQVTFKGLSASDDANAFKDIDDVETIKASFTNVPVELYLEMERHNESLVREFSLLAIQMQSSTELLSSQLCDAVAMFKSSDVRFTLFRAGARSAHRAEQQAFAIDVELTSESVLQLQRFNKWADIADQLSEDRLLLTAPASTEQRVLRKWIVQETTRQVNDLSLPAAWSYENAKSLLSNELEETRIKP